MMKKVPILTLMFFFAIIASAMSGTAPSAPSDLRSLTHMIGIPSENRVIKVVWMPSVDPDGDLNGYGTKWDNSSETSLNAKTHDASAISAESGSLADGTWYFHIRAIDDEYNRSEMVHVGPFVIKTKSGDPVMGDMNGDGQVNLTDAILAIQVCVALAPNAIQLTGDVNSDGRIGMEDAIYILQKVSGIGEN
jgi:hypothetical protein